MRNEALNGFPIILKAPVNQIFGQRNNEKQGRESTIKRFFI